MTKMSLPMRGEWIEISWLAVLNRYTTVSLPMRGEWIEIYRFLLYLLGI